MNDAENENILQSLFKDSYPENWKENSEVARYLSELSSFGVERLNREPEVLAEEKSTLLEQTQELVFNNYKTFIETAQCSKDVFQDFTVIEEHLSSVLDQLPVFVEKCKMFGKNAQDIGTSRHVNSLMLSKHSQLLEVLEMPQLMDTCVRNGYYDEALELSAYVSRLEKKFPSIEVIVGIAKDVQNLLQLMLGQLLSQLRSNIQLPACLRVVGYIRRMDVLTEAELRLKFLQARESWYNGVINAIPTADSYHHITKVIEASRVHLFDIITQYRAIFADDDPVLGSFKESHHSNESSIFLSWVLHVVQQFLLILEHDLKTGVQGRMDSLLGQCMYFGLSFSRVGLDFRMLLVPLFEEAVVNSFRASAVSAAERFHSSVQSYVLTAPPTMLVSSMLSATTSAQDRLHPPLNLLEFQPLAVYCNDILAAFNELRLCAPLSVAYDIANCLSDSLESVVVTIMEFHKAEESVLTPREMEAFVKFCHRFASELVPYMNQCLKAIFPPAQLAQTAGVSLAEFQRQDTVIGCLAVEVLLQPLMHLLPEPTADSVVEELDIGPPNAMNSDAEIAKEDIEDVPAYDQVEDDAAASVDHIVALENNINNVIDENDADH